jgi:hypothetical protein
MEKLFTLSFLGLSLRVASRRTHGEPRAHVWDDEIIALVSLDGYCRHFGNVERSKEGLPCILNRHVRLRSLFLEIEYYVSAVPDQFCTYVSSVSFSCQPSPAQGF